MEFWKVKYFHYPATSKSVQYRQFITALNMSILPLHSSQLRRIIDQNSLGFSDTSELSQQPLTWVGPERAEVAAHFGLNMMQPDYYLFVLQNQTF